LYQGNGNFALDRSNLQAAPLAVGTTSSGQQFAVVANQQTGAVSLFYQTGTNQFTKQVAISTSTPLPQFAPGAVQTFTVGNDRNPYLAVADSLSNDILLYHYDPTSGQFQPVANPNLPSGNPVPNSYAVGDNPVFITVAYLNGPNAPPNLFVVNNGSNDVSELLGSLNAAGEWVGQSGPRLNSNGVGPIAAKVIPNANSLGGFDLAVINSQTSGTNPNGQVAVLQGRGQGFFNDTSPLNNIPLDGTVSQATFNGDVGVAINQNGDLVGFNLATDTSTGVIFTAPENHPVDAVQALADGNLVVAEQGGTVEELNAEFAPVETFLPLDGTPESPSALEVLQTDAGEQVLVTNAGEDKVFVFTVLAPGPATTPEGESYVDLATATAGTIINVAALAEAPLVPAVSLVADSLEGSESGSASGAATGESISGAAPGQSLAQLAQQGQQGQPGGEGGAKGVVDDDTVVTAAVLPNLDDTLRDLDLYRSTEDDPSRPLSLRPLRDGLLEDRALAALAPDALGVGDGFLTGLGVEAERPAGWQADGAVVTEGPARDLVWLQTLPDEGNATVAEVARALSLVDEAPAWPTAAAPAQPLHGAVAGQGWNGDKRQWLLLAAVTAGALAWPHPADAPPRQQLPRKARE
jgi:hypothetical protein